MPKNRTEEDWFLRGGKRPPKPAEQPSPSPAETPPDDGDDSPWWEDLADNDDEDDCFDSGEVASPGGFGPLWCPW